MVILLKTVMVVALTLGLSTADVAFAQEGGPDDGGLPQNKEECEAAGYIWAMDPDGRDMMVCLFVGDEIPREGAEAPSEGASGTVEQPTMSPAEPAAPTATSPSYTG